MKVDNSLTILFKFICAADMSNIFAPSVHTYIHTNIHTNIHTYTHTNIHTYRQTHMHRYANTYTCIHTYIPNTHIHTYIDSYIRTYIRLYIHTYTLFPLYYSPFNQQLPFLFYVFFISFILILFHLHLIISTIISPTLQPHRIYGIVMMHWN